jgi:hypothetical protein
MAAHRDGQGAGEHLHVAPPSTLHRWAHGSTSAGKLQKRDVRERMRRRGLPDPWAT